MTTPLLSESARAPTQAAVGTEWLIDAAGCRPELLRSLSALRRVCERILAQLRLHVVGEGHWHQFPGEGGITGLFLLTESHLACHSYPESGTVTFNLYCCRSRPRWPWEEELRALLGAAQVTVRAVVRGAGSEESLGREEQLP